MQSLSKMFDEDILKCCNFLHIILYYESTGIIYFFHGKNN